jgi:hypothetical protein
MLSALLRALIKIEDHSLSIRCFVVLLRVLDILLVFKSYPHRESIFSVFKIGENRLERRERKIYWYPIQTTLF